MEMCFTRTFTNTDQDKDSAAVGLQQVQSCLQHLKEADLTKNRNDNIYQD